MGKILENAILFQQRDYPGLSRDFADCGCAACCAATIASILEETEVTPKELRDRGVFTEKTCFVYWSKISSRYVFHPREHRGNGLLSRALETIKKEIDAGRPVLLNISGHNWPHYAVAYGYENRCAVDWDVLIREPWDGRSHLNEVWKTWPYFEGINRVIWVKK
ncbi:hypothetical protein [Anaerotruncus rubiinfantis]|uniref:hypothetical protein n=1 Tax=Anaerotruncus rubiinfantis TaxID=1720200 RepID=UPI000834F437|nr:hypothetical protein [Anaerotruncus rubiinfantis]